MIGHNDTMILQDIPATVFEGEAELGVVIGKKCYQVDQSEAMDYVFGYVNFIDGSARGLPPSSNVFFQMKARETFTPIGPYLVTRMKLRIHNIYLLNFGLMGKLCKILIPVIWLII